MNLIEKRSPTKIEECGKSKKVKIVTTFFDSETQVKVGAITQTFTCSDYKEGSPTIITNLIEFLQFVTVYRNGKQVLTKAGVSWNSAVDIIKRERTPWGRFFNHCFI